MNTNTIKNMLRYKTKTTPAETKSVTDQQWNTAFMEVPATA